MAWYSYTNGAIHYWGVGNRGVGVCGWHRGGFYSTYVVNSQKWYTPPAKLFLKKIILEMDSI